MTEPAALLAEVDYAATELEHARIAVRDAINRRTAAANRHRAAVEAFDAWSKQALT